MVVEICSVSGYSDFGKNMTAVKVGNEVILLDMGLHIENYINYTEDEDFVKVKADELIEENAAPNISFIDDWKELVKGIIISHVHLDHVGAVPYLAGRFDAPVICTPFTSEVIKNILQSEKIKMPNKVEVVQVNGKKDIGKIKVELLNMTHSTPETTAIVLHTPDGPIVYMTDFKLDATPTLGKKSNLKRLEELGKQGVLALIIDSTNAQDEGKTPSESVAKEMLRDVMASIRGKNNGIIATTFSSHLARLKSILEEGIKMNRKVMFLGRSMSRYINAGESCGIIKFTDKAKVFRYASQIENALKKVAREGKEKYLLVVSGHQAEPESTLSKIVGGSLKYKLDPRDYVIFSCRVIPAPTNRANREHMEKILKKQGVHVFKDIHQSGHGASEDIMEIIDIVKPKHIIPAHGKLSMRAALAEIARERGYDSANVHLVSDGERLEIE
ncbi:MBL fold metallo-hydrolase [Candidatus Woesearchaeota archaeon]|nr:MBL fold metallo-hydrolase [Candidatus Woesearchaeota archaeon]